MVSMIAEIYIFHAEICETVLRYKATSKINRSPFLTTYTQEARIDLIGLLGVVPNSNLAGLKFFVCFICIRMWHSHLNDTEMNETKRFIPKGFELGTTLS